MLVNLEEALLGYVPRDIDARLQYQLGTLGSEAYYGIFVAPRPNAAEQGSVHHRSIARDEPGKHNKEYKRDSRHDGRPYTVGICA